VMKAAVYSRGDVQVEDVEKPAAKDHEVLVRIHASTARSWGWNWPEPWNRWAKP
jgi:NADPH:quinone reductase-like Zn-dependent oxidoreductase